MRRKCSQDDHLKTQFNKPGSGSGSTSINLIQTEHALRVYYDPLGLQYYVSLRKEYVWIPLRPPLLSPRGHLRQVYDKRNDAIVNAMRFLSIADGGNCLQLEYSLNTALLTSLNRVPSHSGSGTATPSWHFLPNSPARWSLPRAQK